MASFTVQSSAVSGTVLTWNAVNAGGDDFTNDGRTAIIVRNNSGGTLTFDVVTSQVIESDLAVADRQISITNGDYELIGPFNTTIYGSTTSLANYSSTTSVTCAVVKI